MFVRSSQMRLLYRWVSFWIRVLVLCGAARAVPSEPVPRPNIIFFLADDLGFNDVSFRGGNETLTPNIDSLAFSGVILNNYYVQPVCTPSRAALLTGKYPIHTGMQDYVIVNGQPWGLPLEEKLLPEYLNTLGYESHMVGKWHLGFHCETYTPTRRGFKSHLGYWGSHEDYYNHSSPDGSNYPTGFDFRNNMDDVSTEYQKKYATDIFTENALQIIEEHDASKPLFLYLPHLAPHSGSPESLQAPQELIEKFNFIGDTKRRKYAAMLTKLDQSVGRVIEALASKGLLENSVIVFSSDNGGTRSNYEESAGSNHPLRGEKFTLFEGGTRAVGLLWSPLLKLRHRLASQLMHITDWLPTLWNIAGGDPQDLPRDLDGIDVWDAVSDDLPSPRRSLVYNIANDTESNHGVFGAVRIGDYKLMRGAPNFSEPIDGWLGDKNLCMLETLEQQLLYVETRDYLESQNSVGRIFSELQYLPPPSVQEDLRKAATVDCKAPVDGRTPCDPEKEPCVFHLGQDPCETKNLLASPRDQLGADSIFDQLFRMYDSHLASSVKRRNQVYDPESSPKFHGDRWVPWRKDCDLEKAAVLR